MKQKAVVCALSALFSQHYLYAADVQPAQQVELAPVLVTADRQRANAGQSCAECVGYRAQDLKPIVSAEFGRHRFVRTRRQRAI